MLRSWRVGVGLGSGSLGLGGLGQAEFGGPIHDNNDHLYMPPLSATRSLKSILQCSDARETQKGHSAELKPKRATVYPLVTFERVAFQQERV